MAIVKIRNAADTGWDVVGGGVEIVQDPTEPTGTFPGQLWIDTDTYPVDKVLPTVDHEALGSIATVTVDTNGVGFAATLKCSADGNFDTTDADAEATMPVAALALETGTGSKLVLFDGFIRDDTWAWTPGGIIYAGTTVGTMTQTSPSGSGDIVQVVGWALSADIMFFQPNLAYVELA